MIDVTNTCKCMRNSPTIAGFLQCNGGKLEEAEDFKWVLVVIYIPINDTMFKLSVFWPSDTESRINELRFSDSISLSF